MFSWMQVRMVVDMITISNSRMRSKPTQFHFHSICFFSGYNPLNWNYAKIQKKHNSFSAFSLFESQSPGLLSWISCWARTWAELQLLLSVSLKIPSKSMSTHVYFWDIICFIFRRCCLIKHYHQRICCYTCSSPDLSFNSPASNVVLIDNNHGNITANSYPKKEKNMPKPLTVKDQWPATAVIK